MTNVTRFPHYHQPENIVTNHLMVFIRMIHDESPRLLEDLLQSLFEVDLKVGASFSQQIASSNSIPDGLILQEPFSVHIETKLVGSINEDQLKRHCQSIAADIQHSGRKFLISLAADDPGRKRVPAELNQFAQDMNIKILDTTFSELLAHFDQLKIRSQNLQDAAKEFKDFIHANDLVPRKNQTMVAMLTGVSWAENVMCGVYYEPVGRNRKWHQASFLGLYHSKSVSHVGRIMAVLSASLDANGSLVVSELELGTPTPEQIAAIKSTIDAAKGYFPDLGAEVHRFYVVDRFAETQFRKVSAGGMMGHRYFDIEAISRKTMDHDSPGTYAAAALNGREFQ
jgi:hypothetical protein